MRKMAELTKAQDKALKAFSKLESPTIEEYAKKLGVSYGTARTHMHTLIDLGYISVKPGQTRSARLTEGAIKHLARGR